MLFHCCSERPGFSCLQVRLPAIWGLSFLLLSYRLGVLPAESATGLKLLDKGWPRSWQPWAACSFLWSCCQLSLLAGTVSTCALSQLSRSDSAVQLPIGFDADWPLCHHQGCVPMFHCLHGLHAICMQCVSPFTPRQSPQCGGRDCQQEHIHGRVICKLYGGCGL